VVDYGARRGNLALMISWSISMGESAKDQRERLRKGLEGELLAMDCFDAYQISYFAIEQGTHTWS